MAVREKAKTSLDYWLKKTNISQRDDGVEIVSVATDTHEDVELNMKNKDEDRWAQLSKVKTMVNKALLESVKRLSSSRDG